MAFEQLTQLVSEAEVEQQQLVEANSALDAAKAQLATVQTQVAAAQEAVNAASTAAGQEKADVVAKIGAIVTRCNEILVELQS